MSSTAPGHRSVNSSRRTDGGDKRPKGFSKNEVPNRNQQSINQNSKSARPDPNHVNNNSSSKTSNNAHESKSKRVQMTQEQLRIASLMNEKTDLTELEAKVKTLMSLTRIDFDSAIVALHDCDGDLEAAADKILVDDFKNDFIESKPRKFKNEKANAQVVSNDLNKSSGGNRQPHVKGARGGRGNFKPRNDSEPRPENGERKGRERPVRQERPENERDNDRGFRGRGARGTGNMNRNRGSRTFVSNSRPPQPNEEVVDKPVPGSPRNDTLGDKIGTWEPTDGSKPAAAPISHLTVGNWSDVVREDLSEDETTSGKISSAVFVPSGKTLREDPEPPASGYEHNRQQQQQNPPLDQNRAAGAQLLQSLKQSPNQHVQNTTGLYNQAASESLKSLVGISAQTYSGSPDQNKLDNSINHSGKKMSRIPSSAVEMPSNDPVTALGVQFGALDVNFDGQVQQQSNRSYEQTRNSNDKSSGGQHQNIVTPGTQIVDDRIKGYANKSNIEATKSTDLYQNAGQPAGNVNDGFKSNQTLGYGQTTNYSTGFSNNPASFNTYSNQAGSYNQSSSNQVNYSSQGSAKSQQPSSTLRDFQDPNSGQKYSDLHSSGFVSSTQTTNVIKNSLPATGKGQMPNVPAQLPAQMMHPSYMVSSPVGLTPFYPLYPDPSQMQVSAGGGRTDLSTGGFTNYPSGTNLAQTQGIGTDSSKYPRSSQDDSHGSVSSVTSSQTANVSQAGQHSVGQPPFINMQSFPPGYGYYFAMPQQGMFPPHGAPFVPVPSASNAAGTGVGNLFGKGNTGYASYGPTSNAYEVNPADGYTQQKQTSNYGQPRNVLPTDMMTGGSASGAGSFGGKQSNQGSKSSYEKMSYQTSSTPSTASYNMAGAQNAYQGAPYSMVGHPQQQPPQSFQEAANLNRSNQRNTGPGNAGTKGYSGGQTGGYSW